MNLWTRVFLCAFFIILFLESCRPQDNALTYKIIDGDTFIMGKERIRVAGYDAPELGEPGSAEATARLRQLLSSGRISIKKVAHDKYGRTVAKVFVDGKNIARILKVEGYGKRNRPRRLPRP